MIDCVVAPFDHAYAAMPEGADNVTLPPVQNVVGPLGVIVGAGGGLFTVTVDAADVAVQPPAAVTVTVNDPLALTVIDCVVAPFDHNHDRPAEAVSATVPGAQNVVGPEGVIVGAGAVQAYVKAFAAVVVPEGVVTTMSTVAGACAGLVTVICDAVLLTIVAVMPPNVTDVAPERFDPLMTTVVPPAVSPVVGDTDVMTGDVSAHVPSEPAV